jgi:hypothetical protein
MFKHSSSTIVALLILATSQTVSATTVDFGEIAAGESAGSAQFVSGVVDDVFSFSLAESLLVSIVIDSADLDPYFGIGSFSALADSVAVAFTFNPADNSYGFAGVLDPGVYSFDVTGETTGIFGGQYLVAVGALSVPLPGAFWLFSAALLMVGRRNALRATS